MPLFDGKVSIVTGGGSGIGRATALAFAKEGAKVVIADNNVDGGQETAKLLHNGFGRALFVETDVSLDSSVAALVSQTIDTFGRLDCAANIAGVTQPSIPLAETPEELFDRVMAINAKSMFLCMRHEIGRYCGNGPLQRQQACGGRPYPIGGTRLRTRRHPDQCRWGRRNRNAARRRDHTSEDGRVPRCSSNRPHSAG
jgi:NAD(P)-dependent dehydrogenase (short-subunit alcohol dehydrogenase family)